MDEQFMREALRLAAEAAEAGEVPVGAVVVRGGEIVGRGRNRRETDRNALAHAETEAIGDACRTLGGWRLWDCTLYVTLEPCPMCAGAILNARLRRVVFGASDPKAGSLESVQRMFDLPYNHKPQIDGGCLQEECAAQLRAFFADMRRGVRKAPINPNWKNRGDK
ncbi:MAG: nucleoside deaminase [Clostridia bacterium]|nr:nucleoside deaminase [Clostridia bacterium]